MKKIYKWIFNVLFNPIYFLSTIFIAFLINSFFTVSGKDLPFVIGYLVDHRSVTIILIILWIIISFIKNNVDELKKEIEKLNLSIM